jgi:hypothetical protein
MKCAPLDHHMIVLLRDRGFRWREVALEIGYEGRLSTLRSAHSAYVRRNPWIELRAYLVENAES